MTDITKSILYGIGVGPGDPELMTVKAVRILQSCDVVAGPRSGEGEDTTCLAFQIARQYLEGKPTLLCDMPMTRDQAVRETCHEKAADEICSLLDEGKTVAFLTLGDPSIYSTYWYLHRRVTARGYQAALIPGVPSFCAAAAAAGRALCEDEEMLHIIPALGEKTFSGLTLPGDKVLMKANKSFLNIRERLRKTGQLQNAVLVERCGMEDEQVIRNLDTLDSLSEYFSVILVKEGEL